MLPQELKPLLVLAGKERLPLLPSPAMAGRASGAGRHDFWSLFLSLSTPKIIDVNF
jgi:hypothetical protein